VIEESPAILVVYATAIGLVLMALYFLFRPKRRPVSADVERGPMILKAVSVGALVLGTAFSLVILAAIAAQRIIFGTMAP